MADLRRTSIDDLGTLSSESWRTFRIMGELVNALDIMNGLDCNCVSIFGSARTKPDAPYYKQAEEVARLLAQEGFGVITGGGPGIMEAGNKGATEAGGVSVGLHIELPHEQDCNKYVRTRCNFRYFFLRKLMFVKYSMAYIVMPGGIGTVYELAEAFVLAQTQRIRPFPIILYDSAFWGGFIDWMRKSMVGEGTITDAEIDKFLYVCDTPEDIMKFLRRLLVV